LSSIDTPLSAVALIKTWQSRHCGCVVVIVPKRNLYNWLKQMLSLTNVVYQEAECERFL